MLKRDKKTSKQIVSISVRNLVEFLMRKGDIDFSGISASALADQTEGTKVHKKLQKAMGESYRAEIRLNFTREYDVFHLIVQGNADGMFNSDEGLVLDEIKSTFTPIQFLGEGYELHWAQAKCYAYMFCAEDNISDINVRLTYFQIDTGEVHHILRKYTFEELETFFENLVSEYFRWAEWIALHETAKIESIKALNFPFENFRAGQREFAAMVYKVIKEKNRLFAQAPTGTGKTMSTMFPAIKAIGETFGEKLFYLTAKTVTRDVAQKAAAIMVEKGLDIVQITFTAKEKLCEYDRNCDPQICSFAKGHFDRVNDAIYDIITHEKIISREIMDNYSKKHMVCPFEFMLDMSEWADCIVCDYNHVFDPKAHIKRYFDEGGDYTILVDEAHNLVDRAREMFSVTLDKHEITKAMRALKSAPSELKKSLSAINRYLVDLKKKIDAGMEVEFNAISDDSDDFPNSDTIIDAIRGGLIDPELGVIQLPNLINFLVDKFIEDYSVFLATDGYAEQKNKTIDLFFELLSFSYVYDQFDEKYVAYVDFRDKKFILNLFCVDPSKQLMRTCKKCRSTAFFSATLLPMTYFKNMLGNDTDQSVRLVSPFNPKNLCLMVANNVSTKYKDRQSSYSLVTDYVYTAVSKKIGNYFIFFPSFEYMRQVHERFKQNYPDVHTIIQENMMDDESRQTFMDNFTSNPDKTMVAFAVMGGIFSEGIDLVGERLSGAVIVGVGLPQICLERDIIRKFFDNTDNNERIGFEYSYMYPGMNRVMQAAGRVIRTETDRGFVLLIDERFTRRDYIGLFPPEWRGYSKVGNISDVNLLLEKFWNE